MSKLITYNSWTAVPAGLVTETQLKKEGLKPAPGQLPVAYKRGMRGATYLLYERTGAVPKRVMSQAQAEAARRNIEAAQKALGCKDCGIRLGHKPRDGRCEECRREYRRGKLRLQAEGWFIAMAGRDDWLILDTETTGLYGDAEIVQVGVVAADGRVLMNQLIKPLGARPAEATAVHGITMEMLADAPRFPEIYQELLRLVDGRLLLAYNADFDERMVQQTCELYGRPTPLNEWQCVMRMFAQWYGDWSNYWDDFKWQTLGTAVAVRGVAASGLHDAASDALATWRVIKSFGDAG